MLNMDLSKMCFNCFNLNILKIICNKHIHGKKLLSKTTVETLHTQIDYTAQHDKNQ